MHSLDNSEICGIIIDIENELVNINTQIVVLETDLRFEITLKKQPQQDQEIYR